jgi:hypothetical protein
MSSSARRTARRLLKLASLGLAGLIAGLLSVGCNAAPSNAATLANEPHISSNVEFTPSDLSTPHTQSLPENDLPDNNLPDNIEAGEAPALHHPPSARRLEYGSVRPTAQSVSLNSRSGS